MLLTVYNPKGFVPTQAFEVRPDKAKMLVIHKGWSMEMPKVAPPKPALPAPPAAPVAPPVPVIPAAIPDPIVETPLEKDGHEVDVPIPEPAGLSKAP